MTITDFLLHVDASLSSYYSGTEKQKIKEDLYGSILAETKKKPVQQAQLLPCTAENEAEDMVENDLYGT